jgi:hypothetical protein
MYDMPRSACSVSEILEHKIGYYQMGFRSSRSTVDNIYIIQ